MAQILKVGFVKRINLKLKTMKNAKATIKNTRVLDYLIALLVSITLFGMYPEFYEQNTSTIFILSAVLIFESTKFVSMVFRYFFVKQYFKKPQKKEALNVHYIRASFGDHISTMQKEFDMRITQE